jgi:hypothetical protein
VSRKRVQQSGVHVCSFFSRFLHIPKGGTNGLSSAGWQISILSYKISVLLDRLRALH